MVLLPAALFTLCLVALTWLAWRNRAEYAAFKRLMDTRERQRRFRRWLRNGFLAFVVGGPALLAMVGWPQALILEPAPFTPLTRSVRAVAPYGALGPIVLGAIVAGLSTLVVLGALAAQRNAAPAATLGDVSALMPRNGAESLLTALLSVNAGVGEEIVFRLALPLLFALATGSAVGGFLAATVLFGLVHLYQGPVGVAATTVVGLLLAALYLWSGGLAAPIALHVAIDLLGLVVRPAIARSRR